MANDYGYDDDFFDEDDKWKASAGNVGNGASYNTGHTSHTTSSNHGSATDAKSNGHGQYDKRSIKSKTDSLRSSAKPISKPIKANPQSQMKTIPSKKPPTPSASEDEEEEEEEEEPLKQSKTYATHNGNHQRKNSIEKPAAANGRLGTGISYAPSNYEYEDTFVAESDVGHTQSEQDNRRGLGGKNKLLIKKPRMKAKNDQTTMESSTVQRLLSAKNTKMHEYVNRIHELENALQQVHDENKLLKRLQKIQEKEITHFQHDQEEIPRLMQQHSAEIKSVKMMLDKARVKHQKTWKRLLEVENLLREEKQRSENLQQIVDSRDLKERYELDRKLSQAQDQIDLKDRRILELETHVARLEKNYSRQVGSEKTKIKELQNLVEDLQNRNTKLEFSLKEKEKELSIRDIYRQRAIQEPKNQLVPVGGAGSTASSPGLTASTGNIAAASNPRRPHPPPPRRLPPPESQKDSSRKTTKPPKSRPAVAPPPNDSHRSDAQNSNYQPPAPELDNRGFFITQIEIDAAAGKGVQPDRSLNVETAVTAYSPRQPGSHRKPNNETVRVSQDQRRREQEAELDRQLAAEKALQQELLRKQDQEKQEAERRAREEEIKRRQQMLAEADAARARQKEEENRRKMEEQQRMKAADTDRAEQLRLEKQRKDAEANDRTLRQALEAQRLQRAEIEKREKRDWQDAEEKRIKDQVLAKTNARKLDWLSPSPEDDDDDARGNDLLSFAGTKRNGGVPARNTKRLDLLFSDDDDDNFGGSKKALPKNGSDNGKVANNGGGRPRAGAGSMAPFMLGGSDTRVGDVDGSDFLFSSNNNNSNNNKPRAPVNNSNNKQQTSRHNAGGNAYQNTHLFGVDSPDLIL